MAKTTVGSIMAVLGKTDEKRVRMWINAFDIKPRLDVNKLDPGEVIHWIPLLQLMGNNIKRQLLKGQFFNYYRTAIGQYREELIDRWRKKK